MNEKLTQLETQILAKCSGAIDTIGNDLAQEVIDEVKRKLIAYALDITLIKCRKAHTEDRTLEELIDELETGGGFDTDDD